MKTIYFVIGMFLVYISSYCESIDLTFFIAGNFKGQYRELAEISTFLSKIKSENNLILINSGDNITGEPYVNEIFTEFYKKNSFEFNLIGNREFINKEDTKGNLEYSSVNIQRTRDELRYKVLNKGSCRIGIVGITDIYDNWESEAYDYTKELRKLLFKLEYDTDFIVVVSEMKRDENIKLIKELHGINIIIETGDTKLDKDYVRIDESYIVPGGKVQTAKVTYNWSQKKNEAADIVYKNISSIKTEYVDNFSGYEKDEIIAKKIKWKEGQLKRSNEEVAGYNDSVVSYQDMEIGEKVDFLYDIAKQIKQYYKADVVIYPAGMAKGKLEKGFYTKKELDNFFTNDRIVVFSISKAEYDTLYNNSQKNKGNGKYLNYMDKGLVDKKDKYLIVSTENIFENYKIKTISKEVKNIGVRAFAGGGVK